jgi:murein DD-endopeptidase MepM/ murein hydrolase activator NlpD
MNVWHALALSRFSSRRTFLWVLLFTTPFSGRAEPAEKAQELVTIREEKHPRRVEFFAESRSAGRTTLTLSCPTQVDVTANVPLPVTLRVPPGKSVLAAVLTSKAGSAGWRYTYRYRWQHGTVLPPHDRKARYELPYEKGFSYEVVQGFNGKFSHKGINAIDWKMPVGTKVHAARAGLVVGVENGFDKGSPKREFEKKANFVFVLHADGSVGRYLHFRKNGVKVKAGRKVTAGQFLGYSGNTGFSTRPHLHFEVRKPCDGEKFTTIPIRYRTGAPKDEVLKEDQFYMRPLHGVGEEPSPAILPRNTIPRIVPCAAIRKEKPADQRCTFRVDETVWFYMPIHVQGRYEVRVLCQRQEGDAPPVARTVTTDPSWTFCFVELKPELTTGYKGIWMIRVFVGNQEMTKAYIETR